MFARQDSPSGRTRASRPSTIIRTTVLTVVLLALVEPLGRPIPAAAADAATEALARINAARAAIGVAPLKRHAALDAAATAHANYYKLNFGDPALSGMGLHHEQAGKPGFTGADFAARAKAAGYGGSVNENVGLSGDHLVSLEWFMGTIYHRLTLLDPRYTDIGFGAVNEGKAKMELIDLGGPSGGGTPAGPLWTPWPPAGAGGIATRFDGETPNPFPSAKYPLGYPVTLKYHGAGKVAFGTGRLTEGGQPIAALAVPGTGFIARNTFIVAATAPLKPGTAYSVTIGGTLDGVPFEHTWSFTTKGTAPAAAAAPSPTPSPTPSATPTATPAPGAAPTLPAGVAALDAAAAARWRAADLDVLRGAAARTWTWGPDAFAVREEAYDGATRGVRAVYYFDKSRMEINNPAGDRASPWFVTNGLLVREMIAGQLQTGDRTFTPRDPAVAPLAGDPAARNPGAVTYASLAAVASLEPGMHVMPRRVGSTVIETLDALGAVGLEGAPTDPVRYGAYDETLGHNIAEPFWRWLTAQPVDWVYAAGYPLTEPYWTRTRINGAETWVMVQAFERRLLTFVPGNAPSWQVEAGNVGRHYYEWRYGTPPPR